MDAMGSGSSDLESRLARLREELEDLEEERAFVLGQTGLHVSVKEVQRYESKMDSLRSKIGEVEQALNATKSGGA